jgi:serine/threonine-protein kinase HipA
MISEVRVGELVEGDDGRIEFRLTDAYRAMARRPVLGQWFEDHPDGVASGERPGDLPAFFENLVPEGDLRLTLEERLGLSPGDDLGLLCAVGRDLPGAVTIALEAGEPRSVPRPLAPAVDPASGLRFSLAGVQLKFSMVRRGGRFTIPGHDERGGWVAKIAHDEYADLCANEWVTMEWARMLGFDVPETELRALDELVDVPCDGAPDSKVFVIRRHDRDSAGRSIHQEDFQQVVGKRSLQKYDVMTYDKLTLLAMRIVGDDVFAEMMRRLAFVVAAGNADAHMKNWSIVYPDGIRPRLSPLYDQVFTAQWRRFSRFLALKLDVAKEFAIAGLAHVRELARRIGRSPDEAAAIVDEVVRAAAARWSQLRDHDAVTDDYRRALRRHWQKVPLLQPHAAVI